MVGGKEVGLTTMGHLKDPNGNEIVLHLDYCEWFHESTDVIK